MGLAKRFSAAAGAAGVGVAHFKTLAVQAVVKMYGGSVEVGVAGGVDKDLQALAFELEVAVLKDVERHAVFEAGAAASLNEDAQDRLRVGLGFLQHQDLLGGGFGEVDHAYHFIGL